jgi:hypothetical protein
VDSQPVHVRLVRPPTPLNPSVSMMKHRIGLPPLLGRNETGRFVIHTPPVCDVTPLPISKAFSF